MFSQPGLQERNPVKKAEKIEMQIEDGKTYYVQVKF